MAKMCSYEEKNHVAWGRFRNDVFAGGSHLPASEMFFVFYENKQETFLLEPI